jgi:aminoglycoside phosphotransferase (APT) family kinase protein
VVIDWSDSAIGHPFMDLATWLNRVEDPAARRPMLDAWLDAWADAGPRPVLQEAARLALVVGALHQVESYRRIVASLEPDADWGLAGGGPGYARWALAWLDDGLDATVRRGAG